MKFKIKRMIKYTDGRNAVSVCSVTGTLSHLRLSQHTLSVQTMAPSVDRTLCFLQGPALYGYLSVVVNICCRHCGLDWECMLLEWKTESTCPLCVWLWQREFTRLFVIIHSSTSEWVSCRRCRSCQSVNNIPHSTIPLPLCFYSQSLKPADTPSRFAPLPLPFLIIIFWVFGSLLLSRSVSVS